VLFYRKPEAIAEEVNGIVRYRKPDSKTAIRAFMNIVLNIFGKGPLSAVCSKYSNLFKGSFFRDFNPWHRNNTLL